MTYIIEERELGGEWHAFMEAIDFFSGKPLTKYEAERLARDLCLGGTVYRVVEAE